MKCQFFLVLFLLVLSPAVFGQFTGDSYKDAKIKGKVDSVIETRYLIDNDTTDRSRFDRFVYIFNEKGRIVKSTEHSMNGYFTLITVYSYDDKGYIKEKRIDEKDKKVDTLSPVSITTFTYAANHQSVKADRRQTSKNKPDFLTDFTVRIDLDKSGKRLKDSSFYFGTSQITHRHNYRYNTKGVLVELRDAEGALGIIPSKTFFTYDDNGNLVKETRMSYRGYYNKPQALIKTYIRIYTYPKIDSKHNWLIKNEYFEGKLDRITERQITYYK
ncbi:hypothetical protein [Mucilaginibacter panaciglaebae]|uniref:YD repeat-containing protein n=1 Tax=Mucilaginibacter panaciglaebae TaxID=502331 RepID=A0ABP7WTT5_9SPHI